MGGGDGAVLLLITTNGTAGTPGPLSSYPIPGGSSAALLVSNRVVFQGLIPPAATAEFTEVGTQFSGQTSNGTWQAVGSGGIVRPRDTRR